MGKNDRDSHLRRLRTGCWTRTYRWSGIDIEGLDHVRRWHGAMKARPACQRGVEVPFKIPNLGEDKKESEAFAKNAQAIVQK